MASSNGTLVEVQRTILEVNASEYSRQCLAAAAATLSLQFLTGRRTGEDQVNPSAPRVFAGIGVRFSSVVWSK